MRDPLIAVNTCVHELLHALMLDIFEPRQPPSGKPGSSRRLAGDAPVAVPLGGGILESAAVESERLSARR